MGSTVNGGSNNGNMAPSVSLSIPPEFVEAVAQHVADLLAKHQTTDLTPYMTVEEAAEYMRCRPKRIYDLTSQRRLPFVKDGSRTLLRRADLDAHLEGSA